jgi:acetyl-CoA acetyltransferase
MFGTVLSIMADRISNGPFVVWPNPRGPGGQLVQEDWNMYNFANDPYSRKGQLEAADNLAEAEKIGKHQCDELTARRYEQYRDSLKNGREFQERYFFPAEVRSKKKTVILAEDEGVVVDTNLETLTSLHPTRPDGVHSFGGQTHPADGNAAVIVTTREKARDLSADPSIEIRLLSYGCWRVEKGCTPKASLPAAREALSRAGVQIGEIKAVKTHNPFAVNDLYLARNLGIDPFTLVNNYGCPLVFGHPQAPTAARCVIELIEELVVKGGGYGLFTGCAAGDTGAAIVVKVGA